MVVLGIDQSSNFGWAVGYRGMAKPVWGVEKLPKPAGREGVTFIHMSDLLNKIITEHDVERVFFEQTFLPNNDQLGIRYQQIGLMTHIQSVCERAGVRSMQANIRDWRKRFIGKTKSPPHLKGHHSRQWWKDQSVKSCFERGWVTDDDNAADALGIMDFGLCCVDPRYTQQTDALFRRAEVSE